MAESGVRMKRRWLKITGVVVIGLLLVVVIALFTPIFDPDLGSHREPAGSYAEAVKRISKVQAAENKLDLIPEGKSSALLTGSRETTAVVVFHGYTSVPRQFRLIAEAYRAQGYNVWVPRLPYHGESDKMTRDFSKITESVARDFADRNVDIAQGLGDNVVVIGLSGGGSLGVWSAIERTDVDQAVLISPVLHPLGLPEWADRPVARALRVSPIDIYRWWDPQKKADNTEGYNYPRLSLGGLAALLSLTHFAENEVATNGRRAATETLLIRNDGDQRLDSAYNERFVRKVVAPESLHIYRIPASAGLLHNFISPEPFSENHKRIGLAYDYLSEALGIPLSDPEGVWLTEKDANGTVTVRTGEQVSVTLPSNATTGFSWQVADRGGLTQVGEAEYKVSPSTLSGAGGTETFRFRADVAGDGTLRLEYRRPWEAGTPAETTWQTRIITEEAAP